MILFGLPAWFALLLIVPGERAVEPQQSPGYHVIKKLTLGGEGGWDYLTLDSVARRLYIARSTRVMVVDIDKGTLLGEVKNTPGVHGVALVSKLDRGFSSNGGDATVSVFDLKTLKEINRIKVGQRPDAILYDPYSGHVFTGNAVGDMTVIDAQTEKVVGTIKLVGKPEAIVSDEKGRIFVNIETKHEVTVIDAKKFAVLHHWSLAPGEEPTGLAIDLAKGRLFATCHSGKMIVLDAESGKVLDTPAIGKGTDACTFDPVLGLAFSSNGDGTLTIVQENKSGHYEVVENAMTQAGARTMALDTKTHHVFLVTAKPKTGQRRSYEPDSFVILEVGK